MSLFDGFDSKKPVEPPIKETTKTIGEILIKYERRYMSWFSTFDREVQEIIKILSFCFLACIALSIFGGLLVSPISTLWFLAKLSVIAVIFVVLSYGVFRLIKYILNMKI